MNLMKIDLHTHTYYSDDASQSPEELVKAAKTKGMQGIAITDHNTTGAWKRVAKAGKKYELGVILGEEIKIFQNGAQIGEVIGLFLNDEITPGEFPDVRDKIREQGGILVVAHPFDVLRNAFKRLEEFKKDFDAVEVLNSRAVFNRFNKKALEFARKNRIAMTGGSDAHCTFEVGNGYTIADISEIGDLGKAIEKRKTKASGKKSNPLIHSVSTVAKLGFIGKPSDSA